MKKKLIIFLLTIGLFILMIVFMIGRTSKTSESGVYINGEKTMNIDKMIKKDSDVYLDYQSLVDAGIIESYFDTSEKLILIYKNYQIFTIKTDVDNRVVINQEGKTYINLNYLRDKMQVEYSLTQFEESFFLDSHYSVAKSEKIILLLEDGGVIKSLVKKIPAGEEIIVYQEEDGWYRVRYQAFLGYIKGHDLLSLYEVTEERALLAPVKKSIVLAWDFFTKKPKEFIEDPIYPGLNVVSPTWHFLEEDTLAFGDWSLTEYLDHYKQNNIEVWGVFSNSFDPELTSLALHHSETRKHLIEQIIDISHKNNYKGINIDFENVYFEDRDIFSVFIRELYIRARRENLIVSTDITILSQSPTWSLFYDREVIGKYSDYVVLMAYDERTHPSHGIGPIASISWVDQGISGLLEYVHPQKIILGVPFYTRLWETISEGNHKTYDVTAFKLETADAFVQDNDMNVRYDEQAGQNYAEVQIDSVLYQMWLEDETSLSNRLALIHKYGLSGVAVWTLNYSKLGMWRVIDEYMSHNIR
ncbi:MAG: hypothetical protein JXQ26_05765 [Tissierellales bacterium]|nr:hypothetical protein [Tissierellales bacterium]MBN2827473.1 hypothetical protein [Tissierellales bacterium]